MAAHRMVLSTLNQSGVLDYLSDAESVGSDLDVQRDIDTDSEKEFVCAMWEYIGLVAHTNGETAAGSS